eukprot:g7809.t1
MRPTTLQRRGYKQEAFESHFESKFERLKAKQRQGGGYEDDPRRDAWAWINSKASRAFDSFSSCGWIIHCFVQTRAIWVAYPVGG